MSDDNKATLLEANDFITQGDHEGFLSFCTDDTVWEFVGDQTLTGKDAVRAYMKEAYAKPPKFEVENLIGEGDFVVAIGKISLNDKNGQAVNYKYSDVWRFRDGLMAELKAFVAEIK